MYEDWEHMLEEDGVYEQYRDEDEMFEDVNLKAMTEVLEYELPAEEDPYKGGQREGNILLM